MAKRDTADRLTLQARRMGYPARSVFKLEEIQNKFSVMKDRDHILDIGAAPGSWTLFASRMILKKGGHVTAVDLKPDPFTPLPPGITYIQGDACTPDVLEQLQDLGPFNVILSDAAPDTTGNRTVDTARSEVLAEAVLNLAADLLVEGGNLVVKLFQGGGEKQLLSMMQDMFSRAKPFKPKASRNESFEIFLIGIGRRG